MKKKLLLTTAFIALMGGGLAIGGGLILKPLATQFVRQHGFPNAHLDGIGLTPTGIMIDSVSLDGNEFSTIEGINIGFNWIDLLSKQEVRSVKIKDLTLTCEMDEAGHFKIAGWDATWPKASATSGLIPVQSLLLEGVTLDCETSEGNIRVQGKLAIESITKNDKIEEQKVDYAVWAQQHQLSFDTKGSGKISADGKISLSTTINEARLYLPEIEVSRSAGWIDYRKDSANAVPVFSGKLLAGKINVFGALLQDIDLTLDTSKPEAVAFQTNPAGYPDISLSGRWIVSPENKFQILINSQKASRLVDLFLPDKAESFGSWIKNANPLRLSLEAPLAALQSPDKASQFAMTFGDTSTALTGTIRGEAHYHSDTEKSLLKFNLIDLNLAKGKISVSPFEMDTDYQGTPPLDLKLDIKSVDMTTLAEIADIEGLTASGTMSGTIPMTYSSQGLVFGQGSLKNDGQGSFSYRPAAFPASLQGDDERITTVRTALSDFKFSLLGIEMSGALDGKMKTTLKAEGRNPVFGDRPINLNFNLDGDLGAVIKQTLQAGAIDDKIRSTIKGARK